MKGAIAEIDETTEVLAARVAAGPRAARVTAAFYLATRGEDRGALDAVEALLFARGARGASGIPSEARHHATRALEMLAEKGTSAARTRAQAIAERFVRAALDVTKDDAANHVGNALHALAGAASAPAVLETVLREATHWLLRGQAFDQLAGLGRVTVEGLCGALADGDLRSSATRALATGAAGADDPRVLEAVAEALVAEQDEDVCGALVAVLVAHRGPLAEVLPRVEHKLDGWTRMQLRWLADGLGPREAAERLAAAGVIEPPPARRLTSIEGRWRRARDPRVLLELFGDERVEVLDLETADRVSDHAALCKRLARLAGDALHDLDAEQIGGPREARYAVRVTAAGCEHRFTVENRGDWYDLPAVLRGLDALLTSAGRAERYFALETSDQTALVLYASDAPFREIAARLAIPMFSEPER